MSDQIIRRFRHAGIIDDDKRFKQAQETYKNVLETEMRDQGFVPLYDIDPVFRTYWNSKDQWYEFSYTMQGVYVGEEKAWRSKGVINNRLVGK